jgi:SPP1 Gp6-like portal protein
MTQTPAPMQPQYEITEQDRKRVQAILDARKAYDGEFDAPLKKMPDQTDDNVIANRCQIVVDRGVDFLFGDEIEISAEENAPEAAQQLLDDTWGRKEARIPLLQKLAMNGAISGQAFLRIVPEPGENGGNTYRLVIIDPATVYVKTAPQDCETVLLYCIQYSIHQIVENRPTTVYYREEITRIDPDHDGDGGNPFADIDASWGIQHWTRVGDRGPWIPAGDSILWPYHFPPIFSCQNMPRPNDTWGVPDITKSLIGMNNALNFNLSNINRDGRILAQPIIYATGTGQQDISIIPGKIIGLPLPESKIAAVPISADIANLLSFAKDLRSEMGELSGVPDVASGRATELPRGNIAGVAIELMFMPLTKKTGKKRALYGDLIINVSKALFVLAGLPEDIDVTLNWSDPLPHDDVMAMQGAVLKKQVGVSESTIQRELGYDPDEETILRQKEQAVNPTEQPQQQMQQPMMQGYGGQQQ